MIRWFFKYGYVVFLLNTILYSINSTKDSIAPVIFLVIMFSTLFFLIINPRQIREVLFHKSFLFLLLLNLINFSYFLIFDDISNLKSLEYLMARAMQFSLISLSIYYNLEYFKKKFLDHLLFSIYLIVFLSLIFHPNIFLERYSGIVWNPNGVIKIIDHFFSKNFGNQPFKYWRSYWRNFSLNKNIIVISQCGKH